MAFPALSPAPAPPPGCVHPAVLWNGLYPGLSVSLSDLQVDGGQAGTGRMLPAEGGGGKSL